MKCWITGWLLLCTTCLTAQEKAATGTAAAVAINPFEIEARLPETPIPAGNDSTGVFTPRNPFDVVAHSVPGISAKGLAVNQLINTDPTDSFFKAPKGNRLSPSFLFIVIILFTGFFVFAAAANRSAMLKAWRSFLSVSSMNAAQREASGSVGNRPYTLMYISFLLNAGLFIFLIVQAFFSEGTFYNFWVFIGCQLAAWGLFLLKHVMLNLISWLVPSVAEEVRRYNFLIIVFNCVLGFFLIPFNYLIAFFGDTETHLFMALWTLALAGIFFVYRYLRALGFSTKILSGHQFHFLMYLCVVEIAPFLIWVKLILGPGNQFNAFK
jgi:Domain of unknown function (DUF4271)